MLRSIWAKIREWKERRREKEIFVLRSELNWTNGVLEQIQIEGESLGELIETGHGHPRNVEEWMSSNQALRIRYSERKANIERRLSKMGVAV